MESQFRAEILQQFRELCFPAIAKGVITGYNVYKDRKESRAPHRVNYLHSDLGLLPDGRQHPHRQELTQKLEKFGPARINENVIDSVVDRVAVYKIGAWEENPTDLVFYDAEGKIIPRRMLQDHDGIIIAEGRQYDLAIDVYSQRDLEKVIAVLNKYTYAKKVGRDGRILNAQNPHAIVGAWEIPLITLSSKRISQRRGFVQVPEVCIFISGYEGSTLTKAPERFKPFLDGKVEEHSTKTRLVNGSFVKSYLEVET